MSPSESVHLLGLVGSVREGSWNRALFDELVKVAPEGVEVVHHGLGALPLLDPGAAIDPFPPPVEALRAEVERADGLLLVTPEYNYGVPAVLKNAVDWLSRPAYRSPLRDKPVAILGGAPGPVGSARAQGQLKQNLLGTASAVFPWPELVVGAVHSRFDDGDLADDEVRSRLTAFVEGFVSWVHAVGPYRDGRRRQQTPSSR
ncbi:MAG: NAD(P)H-dependent oxidoreductase [Acidimicrobiia bacterium]|nr:NAD(P)H-dependent oxidoreductase [Acidimicrobiia bacterium]